jgi:hypothetical protein
VRVAREKCADHCSYGGDVRPVGERVDVLPTRDACGDDIIKFRVSGLEVRRYGKRTASNIRELRDQGTTSQQEGLNRRGCERARELKLFEQRLDFYECTNVSG